MRELLALLTLLLAADAGAVVHHKLNAPLAGGQGDVGGASRYVDHPFLISPDSRWVVYLANQDRADAYELHSVSIDGGPTVRLNADLPERGNVSGADPAVDHPFRITPDSRRVIYLADQDADEVFELYSVPIQGGEPVRLNRPLPEGGDVRGASAKVHNPFRISPDGRYVVYLADGDVDEVFELYSVPVEGGEVRKLNPRLADHQGDVRAADPEHPEPFLISPDGRRVVYVADGDTDEVYELYSVPIVGGKAVKLNPRLARGQGDLHHSIPHPFRISPNSRRVVYVADQDRDDVYELYSVSIAGGEVLRLNPRLARGGNVGGTAPGIDAFRISPDSRFVVYLADQETDEVFELWSVPIAGGEATKLNPVLAGGEGDVRGTSPKVPNPFRISPNSQRVVYVADQDVDESFELYSVPIVGGTSTKLNTPLAGGRGDIRGPDADFANPFILSPDSQRVIYISDGETRSVFELWSVPLVGGRVVKLNPLLAAGRGEVRGADNAVEHPFRITPDGRHVVYVADQELVGVMELYLVPIAGGPVTKLNPTMAHEEGTVVGADYEMHNPFLISPDGQHVVYVGDQETDEVIELFASHLFGINVQGLGVDIVDGEYAPQGADGTDFGVTRVASGKIPKNFTIQNTGDTPLDLGSDAVSLSGEHAGDFRVVVQPDATVPPGGETAFTVELTPRATGKRHAVVSIEHGDLRPYTFAIRGTGAGG